jgi:hypothetical protein
MITEAKMATKPRSKKIPVVEYLYEKLKAEGRTIATLTDVRDAILVCNERHGLGLSASNPANFMKDLVRGRSASLNWPDSLKALRIGGRQRVGEGRVFEFLPYLEGQTEPFEASFQRSTDLAATPVQSISMPLTAKSLGRKDESWLIQVAVGLRVIEQHFATRARAEVLKVLELTHLQIGVKLATSEVDSVFLALVERQDGARAHALVTCEAKQDNERILEHQIIEQIVAANKSVKTLDLDISLIIPIAIQACTDPVGSIYIAEFQDWTPEQAETEEDALGNLTVVAEGLYQLCPPVPGVGYRTPRMKSTKVSSA